jgi:hypothetical protein
VVPLGGGVVVCAVNTAETDSLEVTERLQVVDVPEQEPPHEVKSYPEEGVAVRVILVPEVIPVWLHVEPQEMALSEEVIVPPLGEETVRVYVVGEVGVETETLESRPIL